MINLKQKFWVLTVILLGLVVASCCIGRYPLSLSDIWAVLTDTGESVMDHNVFFKIRLPRTFFVVLSGAALSLAGFVYQGIFKNPLVSPDVLGVSSGASIGAIFGILYFESNVFAIQSLSFIAGILVVLLAVILARWMKGSRIYAMIIAGIIIGAMANSVIMTLKYVADPNRELPAIEYWLMGSFNITGWNHLKIITPIICSSSFLLFLIRWKLQVITLGDEEAQTLGVNVVLIRTIAILCATILVSSVVSVAGVVSWVGLIVPHMTRLIWKESYVENFSLVMLCGSILLLTADLLARTLFSAEIPISILTTFIGSMFLIIFLSKKGGIHQ